MGESKDNQIMKSLPEIDNDIMQEENEHKKMKMSYSEDDLQTSLEAIEKFDVILKMKLDEEKRARLCRMQAVEKTRHVLNNLPCPKNCNGIKSNLEEFIRLLEEEGKSDSDHEKEDEEKGIIQKEEQEKISCQKSNRFKFIERNIELAKCGSGILSLTEGEKLRIQHLLVDLEDSNVKEESANNSEVIDVSKSGGVQEDVYGLDECLKSNLNQINEKLEVFRKEDCSETKSEVNFLETTEDKCETEIKKEDLKLGESSKKKVNSLKEVDKLLNDLNAISTEEICPLPQEEIELLVEQSRQNLRLSESQNGDQTLEIKEKDEMVQLRLSQEVINDLVSHAKTLLPKFKYRFDEI